MTTIIGRLATDATMKRVGVAGEHERTELIVLENTGRMTSEGWKSDDEPTRHIVHAWREIGQRAAGLATGDAVIVVGREHTQSWIDRDTGEKRRRRVIEAEHIGVNLRGMQVQARKPRKPGLDAEAQDAWANLATQEPSVRTTLTEQEMTMLYTALEDAIREHEQRAGEERENVHSDAPNAPADYYQAEADTIRALAERVLEARRIILEERPKG